MHIKQITKNPWHKDVVDLQMCNCVRYICIYLYGLSLNGWHALFRITNNHHGVTITMHAVKRHFHIHMVDGDETTYELPMFLCFNLKIHLYLCLLVNETKNPQHLDCGRSIPVTHGGWNDSRLGGASSGIVLSPIHCRYRSTTSRCSGFL